MENKLLKSILLIMIVSILLSGCVINDQKPITNETEAFHEYQKSGTSSGGSDHGPVISEENSEGEKN